jgi:hypothetical protein
MAHKQNQVSSHPFILLFERPQMDIEKQLLAVESLLTNGDCRPTLGKAKIEYRFVEVPTEIPLDHTVFFEAPASAMSTGLEIYSKAPTSNAHQHVPIRQACLGEAAVVGSHLGAAAIYWKPAKLVSGFTYFHKSLIEFERGGPFPILSTVHFKTAVPGVIQSSGLAWFCAQEIDFRYEGLTTAEAMHRCVRLSHDMIINGRYTRTETVDGMAPEETLKLVPTANLDRVMVIHKVASPPHKIL